MIMMPPACKGFSSVHFAKPLVIKQKMAWSIKQRIRKACEPNNVEILKGEIEEDLFNIGGQRPNMSNQKRNELQATAQDILGQSSGCSNSRTHGQVMIHHEL